MSAANESMTPMGYVHSVETFGLVDGPGVRYVLFLQGCRRRANTATTPRPGPSARKRPDAPTGF